MKRTQRGITLAGNGWIIIGALYVTKISDSRFEAILSYSTPKYVGWFEIQMNIAGFMHYAETVGDIIDERKYSADSVLELEVTQNPISCLFVVWFSRVFQKILQSPMIKFRDKTQMASHSTQKHSIVLFSD